MITCPNCAHQNPDAATQCEACYTPLPAMTSCPSCGSAVSATAEFCGQCGLGLHSINATAPNPGGDLPPTIVTTGSGAAQPISSPNLSKSSTLPPTEVTAPNPTTSPAPVSEFPNLESEPFLVTPPEPISAALPNPAPLEPVPQPIAPIPTPVPQPVFPAPIAPPSSAKTQLQQTTARFLHIQSNLTLEIPANLNLIHIGKPNEQIPPDIDVSGFADADIVSRVHADVRVEGDSYYIEDVGSSNGTYVNNLPLHPGNRHRLRPGDRISFGKGDKVSFLFLI